MGIGLAVLSAPVQGEVSAFPQDLQHVSRTLCHGQAHSTLKE